MHPPSKPKTSPRPLAPVTNGPPGPEPVGTRFRSRPLRCSMKSLPTSSPNALPCTMPAVSLPPLLQKTPRSPQGNALRPTTHMVTTWRGPLLHGCEQSPEVAENRTGPHQDQTLLERMGLGNQTL